MAEPSELIDGHTLKEWLAEREKMCLEYHPIHHVACMRNKGHAGKHWHSVRWTDNEEVLAQYEELHGIVLRLNGLTDG